MSDETNLSSKLPLADRSSMDSFINYNYFVLSLLTMTNPNQMREVLLLWLMRLILAQNCLLQIEHERSEEDDALALAFR